MNKQYRQAVAFAKEVGYDGALKGNQWNGYTVYVPYYDKKDKKYLDAYCILCKGSDMRLSSFEEGVAYFSEADNAPGDDRWKLH